jgi:LmbE family N-acetylglucosaminyl deacetylase
VDTACANSVSDPVRIRVLLAVLLLGWCESGAGRVRAVRAWVPRSILVITAHPDDEILLAPFLAAHCVDRHAACSILVLTRGEGGGDPDVRTGEMARAAALLNLRLMQWSLPDIMEPWPERETLVRQIGDVIASERPGMILTFDPAHGTTGHPAHRETGALVRDTGAPNVWFLETLARFEGDGFVLSPADPQAWAFRGDWNWAVRDAAIHASQFTPAQVESLATLPAGQRLVWLRQAP